MTNFESLRIVEILERRCWACCFLVLEHLIETLEGGRPLAELTRPFLDALGCGGELTFCHTPCDRECAHGHTDAGLEVAGSRKQFPALAAGALGSPRATERFLDLLARAHRDPRATFPISHDTACLLLHGTDLGCKDLMGCLMGLGILTIEAGPNKSLAARLACH
jgi:hypothetical protein